ncbi:hypothetical protein GCM10027286_00090 [Virgibacillus ainsalahensis]
MNNRIKEVLRPKVNFWDIILIIGVIAAPMTTLRVGKIGISELFLFVWSFKILINLKFKIKINYFILFWFLFDIFLLMGLSYRYLNSIYTGSFLSESITFVFFNFIILAFSQYFRLTSYDKLISVLKKIFLYGFIVYFSLYIYSILVSQTLLGYPLWYFGERLSLLADNPHQLVFLLGPLVLVGLFLLSINTYNNISVKAHVFVMIVLLLWMTMETKSSTVIAVFTMLVAYILFTSIRGGNSPKKQILFLGMKIAFLVSLIMIFISPIIEGVIIFINSDVNGIGRIKLWWEGIGNIWASPIVGLGPGAHINVGNSFGEAHNTYIDIALRSGLLGMFVYVVLLGWSLYKTRKNVFATSIVLFFVLYGMAGYSIRRVTLWFFIMVVVYICKKRTIGVNSS